MGKVMPAERRPFQCLPPRLPILCQPQAPHGRAPGRRRLCGKQFAGRGVFTGAEVLRPRPSLECSLTMSVIMKIMSPPPVADINVTPMVDVMLVLLIIFMVLTPMLSKGISVDMVKTVNPVAMQAADKSDAIIVAVTRDGKTFLGV